MKIPGVLYAEFILPLGHVVIDNNSMAQSVFRAYINAQNHESLQKIIKQIQANIKVQDVNGENMLFKQFDTNRIKNVLSKR